MLVWWKKQIAGVAGAAAVVVVEDRDGALQVCQLEECVELEKAD